MFFLEDETRYAKPSSEKKRLKKNLILPSFFWPQTLLWKQVSQILSKLHFDNWIVVKFFSLFTGNWFENICGKTSKLIWMKGSETPYLESSVWKKL